MSTDEAKRDQIKQKVRDGYSKIAQDGIFTTVSDEGSCCAGGGCCGPATFDIDELVENIGYTEKEVQGLPDGANMGLSCGNPTAIAELTGGEVVLDLGSGGGFDVFIAAPHVGQNGKVIGVDMTPDMITKARQNAVVFSERTGLTNVDFRLGEIEHLPVGDDTVDVVISNCVLNLSPDKPQVWREMARVLKPGGRVALSDLALLQPLPDKVLEMVDALVGCIAGACLLDDMVDDAKNAGLADIEVVRKSEYVDTLIACDDPLYAKIQAELPEGAKLGEFVTSVDFSANLPQSLCS